MKALNIKARLEDTKSYSILKGKWNDSDVLVKILILPRSLTVDSDNDNVRLSLHIEDSSLIFLRNLWLFRRDIFANSKKNTRKHEFSPIKISFLPLESSAKFRYYCIYREKLLISLVEVGTVIRCVQEIRHFALNFLIQQSR